jgi:hypothetical protein
VLLVVFTVINLHPVKYSNESRPSGDRLWDQPPADPFPTEAEVFRFAATAELMLSPTQLPSEWDTESTEAWA